MSKKTSRRDFFRSSGAGFVGAAAVGALAGAPATALGQGNQAPPRGTRFLLRGGCMLSVDPKVGDFERADVLIDGTKIAAVQPNITAGSAQVIDASNMIVMPGFIDTHRHMWLGPLRNLQPDGRLNDYGRDFNSVARKFYRPDDCYIGDLVSALGAINAGVTSVFSFSNIANSPAHSDATIQGLRESGLRGVYGYGAGVAGPESQYPQDIKRLKKQYFSSDDQLLTMKLAAGTNTTEWALAREVGVGMQVHILNTGQLAKAADAIRPDCTFIHCTNFREEDWQLIVKGGASVSIAGPIEMEMGHGDPPIQQSIDHGIRPSLSCDVETQMPGDFFTQMRSIFTLQRMLIYARERAGEKNVPPLLTTREVVEFATIEGARDNQIDGKVGTLTPGKEADIIVLRTNDINVMPLNNAYGAVVLAMDTSNVDTVFIGGKLRKWQGRLVDVDLNKISKLVHASRDYLFSRTGWPRDILRPGTGFVATPEKK